MTGDWDSYRNALTRYNIAIRKAKRQSWRKYCKIPSFKNARKKIGTLKRADGSFTMTGQEIIK